MGRKKATNNKKRSRRLKDPPQQQQKQSNQQVEQKNGGLEQGTPADVNVGQQYGETEMALLRLHTNLVDFYNKNNPENVNEEVLTILMQFFIDAGGVSLNKKLMAKYGEDLQTFRTNTNSPKRATAPGANLQRISRLATASKLEDEYQMQLPPTSKAETNFDPQEARKSYQKRVTEPKFDRNRKKKKISNPELDAFKKQQEQETAALDAIIDKELFGEREDPKLKLFLLDKPDEEKLTTRDLIEAFYSKHDEAKLDNDATIDKFVKWVKDNSLQKLSDKLDKKYRQGLLDPDIKKLARRRKNLETCLTVFYMKHDRPKLDTRWTIRKILSWTMSNGVSALNKKFITRYGYPVVRTKNSSKKNEADDLPI